MIVAHKKSQWIASSDNNSNRNFLTESLRTEEARGASRTYSSMAWRNDAGGLKNKQYKISLDWKEIQKDSNVV